MRRLSEVAARATIAEGELPEEVRTASSRVAVVLTQSWCPDWFAMQDYLEELEEEGLTIFVSEYDREPFFKELMRTKEKRFGNRLIPYVRYYRDGVLVAHGNAEFRAADFLSRFE